MALRTKRARPKQKKPAVPKVISTDELCKSLVNIAAFQIADEKSRQAIYAAVKLLQQLARQRRRREFFLSEGTMKVYGGFVDNKLHWRTVDDGFGGNNWRKTPALFKRREEAKVQYEDVRPVQLQELPKPKWGKRS